MFLGIHREPTKPPRVIVAALGDSLSGGYAIDGHYVDDANASYPALVAQQIGATQIGIVAIAGATIRTITGNLYQLPVDADLLIVNAGTNDMVVVAAGVQTLDEARAAFDAMLARSREWMPRARVIVVGIRDVAAMDPACIAGPHAIRKLRNPGNVRAASLAFNRHILGLPDTTPVDLASRAGADSIELFPDAIHPSPLGVTWIAAAVLEAI
jgi:lysophospholipase L1-like esterase